MTAPDTCPLDSERIVSAAILHGKMIVSMPAPARHHDLIRQMHDCGLGPPAPAFQGFLTSTGRFVSRRLAMEIAELQGQIKEKTSPVDLLFSEDVW